MIHDPKPEDIHLGPVMKPEEQLLTAICNLTDPKVVIEFGYYNGTSAKAMLEGMDSDATMVSYDILERMPLQDPRHQTIIKDMKEWNPEDIRHKKIDIVFFDASHVLEDTVEAFKRVRPYLKPGSLILVHDTGAYHKEKFNPTALDFIKDVRDEWVFHCPDEHIFIKLLQKEYGYHCINLTSTTKIRHGIAVLQLEPDFEKRLA